jgi:signal transduction histidine kinase
MAQLSHELRTPLNAILGWSSMLRRGDVEPEKVSKALEVIDRNAHSQLRIVEDLLDISRVITGKLEIERAPVSLDTVVRRAIDVVQLAADARQIQIRHANDAPHDCVRGDAQRLQQVVWNLLSNSIKFTPPGGLISTRIRLVNENVVLTVSDTGEGIDPAFVPYAFDIFRQAQPSSRGSVGLGLGLSLVKQIVVLHGGTVRIENVGRSHGTSVEIALPHLKTAVRTDDCSAPTNA